MCLHTMLMREVFPAPFEPRSPKHFPLWMASEKPLTATFSAFPSFGGYTFLMLSIMME